MGVSQLFSGVVLDQNATATGSFAFPATYVQTFTLPGSYVRGENGLAGDMPVVPDLAGFQLYVNVSDPETAALSWELDVQDGRWMAVQSGTSIGTAQNGAVWFNVFFDDPVPVDPKWLGAQFRLVLTGAGAITGVNYSAPNPLLTGAAFASDGVTAMSPGSSLMFRVLAQVADSGIDFLGNVYRSVAVTSSVQGADSYTLDLNSYWLSQPSPSQFAVQSLYFDETQEGQPAVIDRITVDPLTPGVYFNVYYSTDPTGPGYDTPSWEQLLWTPVYQRFQMNRRQTFPFPEPVVANYVKVEFTQLQSRTYNAGQFQMPCTYEKFPRWVYDYYLVLFASQNLDLLASGTSVTYDALDLAFTYYSDDIIQAPAPPALVSPPLPGQLQFSQGVNSPATSVDPETLAQITLAFQPFLTQPALMGPVDSILASYTASTATSNYSTETISAAVADTTVVSNLSREPLLIEKGFPVMQFFLTCRHTYQLAQASFQNGVAYYAGVQQIAFHRDTYTGAADQNQYNEPLADGTNLQVNDFNRPVPIL